MTSRRWSRRRSSPHPRALDGAPWYAETALEELPADGIELLLVDGPPGYGDGMARQPLPGAAGRSAGAWPRARSSSWTMLERDGESEILDAWERDEGFGVRPPRGGANRDREAVAPDA